MRNTNRDVPRLSNPNFGSINIRPEGAGGDAGGARIVAENQLARWHVVVDQIRYLKPRYEAARDAILALKPREAIPVFGRAPDVDADVISLDTAFQANDQLVLGLEARAEELERERVADLPEAQRLRIEVDELKGLVRAVMVRLSILEGQSPTQEGSPVPASKASAPLLVPYGGAPGLGGVSASFAAAPSVDGGGVRRLGRRPG